MAKNKMLKHYVSPVDKFIFQFDRDHPELSKSQKKEIAKYERIYKLRDDPNAVDGKALPEDF